jgi:hypothetical protein
MSPKATLPSLAERSASDHENTEAGSSLLAAARVGASPMAFENAQNPGLFAELHDSTFEKFGAGDRHACMKALRDPAWLANGSLLQFCGRQPTRRDPTQTT